MNIFFVIIDLFHILATIGWIGAMLILTLVIIPSAKETLQEKTQFKVFMKAIGEKMTPLVNISIIILIFSGIALGILVEAKTSSEIIYLIIKHLFISIMVIIHVSRIVLIGPKIQKEEQKDKTNRALLRLKKLQSNLVWINLILGIMVLLLSVIL